MSCERGHSYRYTYPLVYSPGHIILSTSYSVPYRLTQVFLCEVKFRVPKPHYCGREVGRNGRDTKQGPGVSQMTLQFCLYTIHTRKLRPTDQH